MSTHRLSFISKLAKRSFTAEAQRGRRALVSKAGPRIRSLRPLCALCASAVKRRFASIETDATQTLRECE